MGGTIGLKGMVISKGTYGHGEFNNVQCIALVGADIVFSTTWPQTTLFHRGYKAQNGNMRKFGPTYPHGTALAPK